MLWKIKAKKILKFLSNASGVTDVCNKKMAVIVLMKSFKRDLESFQSSNFYGQNVMNPVLQF